MRPHDFVHSWGRKMFFGQGWPLLCLVSIGYLRADIVPTSPLELFYFIVTLIGHFGLLTALLYFILYWPLSKLFPNYYFARIWSMLLIVMAGLLVFLDSSIFTLYRFHFNGFIWNLVVEGGAGEIFKFRPSFYIISATIFLAAMTYIWYRGERVWRSMQRRFSNPNSNWYLVMIGCFLLISHALHVYGDAYGNRKITRHAQLFPLYFPLTAKGVLGEAEVLPEKVAIRANPDDASRDFVYPTEKMNCPGTENKNILMFTVNNWVPTELNESMTPLLWHYVQHGLRFDSHLSTGTKADVGIFSLFYALPGGYMRAAKQDQVAPVFLQELIRRNYEIGVFPDHELDRDFVKGTVFLKAPPFDISTNVNEDLRKWLELLPSSVDKRPFFALVAMKSSEGIDGRISEIVEGLHARGQTGNTIVIITGTEGRSVPHEMKVPLLIIWPDKAPEKFSHMTSHYDIVPTLMKEEWKCSNDFSKYSDGRSLFDSKEREWYLIGNEHEHEIIDFKNQLLITVNPVKGYQVQDFGRRDVSKSKARKDLILSALRNETRFTRH